LAGVVGGNAISPNFGNGGAPLLSNQFEISFTGVVDIPLGTIVSNPIELLKIQFVKAGGALDNEIMQIIQYFSAEIRKTAGTGSSTMTYESSVDGISWSLLNQICESAVFFKECASKRNINFLNTNVLFLRVVLYNTTPTGVGQIQFARHFDDLVIPSSYTVNRLI